MWSKVAKANANTIKVIVEVFSGMSIEWVEDKKVQRNDKSMTNVNKKREMEKKEEKERGRLDSSRLLGYESDMSCD